MIYSREYDEEENLPEDPTLDEALEEVQDLELVLISEEFRVSSISGLILFGKKADHQELFHLDVTLNERARLCYAPIFI